MKSGRRILLAGALALACFAPAAEAHPHWTTTDRQQLRRTIREIRLHANEIRRLALDRRHTMSRDIAREARRLARAQARLQRQVVRQQRMWMRMRAAHGIYVL